MITHTKKNGKLYFRLDNDLLAVVSCDVLSRLLDDKKKTKKEKPKTTNGSVENFIKEYLRAKDNFYKRKLPKNVLTKNSKLYHYFVDACKLANELGISGRDYIKAQIKGLSFIDSGRGQFPKPNQLIGENAMNRALDYVRESNVSEDDIVLSNIDTWKPLEDNTKYQACLNKIADGKATLAEAYYVKKVQQHWKGKPSMEVEVYIEVMEEDEH